MHQQMLMAQGGGGGGGPTLVSRLRFNGANGSTTITDELPHSWTAYGNAQLDTSIYDEGTSSLKLDGSGDYVSCPDTGGTGFLNFATDNYSIKARVYYVSGSYKNIILKRANGGVHGAFLVRINPTGGLQCGISNGDTPYEISPSAALSSSAWYDVEFTRIGTTITQYINSVSAGSLPIPGSIAFNADARDSPISIGAMADGNDALGGNIDLIEIWKL